MTDRELRRRIKRQPARPGVYLFRRGRQVIYVGKAASLRDRLRGYLAAAVWQSRGPRVAAMVAAATGLAAWPSDSVLEAFLLETRLIQKYQPRYNVLAKDDKSFWYLLISAETYPRVLPCRQKDLAGQAGEVFGPFPQASEFRTALKLLRRIFPWRDRCSPGTRADQVCWAAGLGLCPGVCVGRMTAAAYRQHLDRLKLFLTGKKSGLIKNLTRAMRQAARRQQFERAAELKKQIAALSQIQDIALLKNEPTLAPASRWEAYDVAHTAGGEAVGVMVVSQDGQLMPTEYRRFRLRQPPSRRGDDLAALRELLTRRFRHREWALPELVLVDGGAAQAAVARQTLRAAGFKLPIIAVVKDPRHRPQDLLGAPALARVERPRLLALNQEAHRFALRYHRQLRDRIV